MSEFLSAMTLPFLACLLLAGIHVYLGIHVIARKVIFVDLALAQIAALGAVYGILLGFDPVGDYWPIKGFSLFFALVGALVFSLTRVRHEKVPHEAIIGITYAVALSATILASAHLPHGADEVRELLAGNILWVDSGTILSTALLYGAIGVFHFIFRRQFLMVSLNVDEAEQAGLNVKFWDFLFYFSFGFVVTSSVSIAGVLLVFCYLVIPAVVAMLLAKGIGGRLAIGWTVGALISFLGVVVSYVQDLPSGPTIVVCFAAFLVLVALVLLVVRSSSPFKQAANVVCVSAVVIGFAYASTLLHRHDDKSPMVMLGSSMKNERLLGMKLLGQDKALLLASKPALLRFLHDADAETRLTALDVLMPVMADSDVGIYHTALKDSDDRVRELANRGIRSLAKQESVEPLLEAIKSEEDEYIKVELAESVLELGDARGIPVLIDIMDKGETEQVRQDAHEHLLAHTQVDLSFSAKTPAAQNGPELSEFHRWWQTNQKKMRFNSKSKRFVIN